MNGQFIIKRQNMLSTYASNYYQIYLNFDKYKIFWLPRERWNGVLLNSKQHLVIIKKITEQNFSFEIQMYYNNEPWDENRFSLNLPLICNSKKFKRYSVDMFMITNTDFCNVLSYRRVLYFAKQTEMDGVSFLSHQSRG